MKGVHITMIIKFGSAELTLSEKGVITNISFLQNSIFPENQCSYLIRLFKDKNPCEISHIYLKDNLLIYQFTDIEDEVIIKLTSKEDYTVFEVEKCPESFDFITIGPIVTKLNDVVGDVIGVVQGEDAAIGIQALNIKTLAGFPPELSSHIIHINKESTSSLTVGNTEYHTSVAYSMPFGSVLQLFCENRKKDRIKSVWYAENCIPAPMLEGEDADIRGCKFALFACSRTDALNTIGKIEVEEDLPHPTLDGEWLKTSRKAVSSYLIGEFGIQNINTLIDYAKKGGFSFLYHPHPFETWGHFDLRKDQFPEGDFSLKECTDKAAAQGIKIGLHTLTNFTTTNDTYVTPIPDKGLQTMLPGILENNITKTQTEISIHGLGGLEYVSTLNCIRIEDELIQFSEYEVISENNFILTNCIRGIFDTIPSFHEKGCKVYKLADHPYHTFFPDIKLQDKYSDRIAELFNLTNIKQISFDGLEGCEWTGEGEYAINRFCMRCYEKFNHLVLNDASRLHHFLWHMNTRMNWGEPWGEEMRTGQVEGRMKNQEFFRKNLFPRMLGWFLIRKADRKFEASTLLDVEWALSEAAGFDAGFAITTSCSVLDTIGTTDEILDAIKNWELLRFENRFDDELKELLKKPETEWHLEKIDETYYKLYPMAISKPLICDLLEMQPGQPGGSDWTFENKLEKQEFSFRMKVEGNGYIENPKFYNRSGVIQFHAKIKGGQYLIFDDHRAFVTDRNFNKISEVEYKGKCFVEKNTAQLSFSCLFGGEEGPEIKVRIITKSEPYMIQRT